MSAEGAHIVEWLIVWRFPGSVMYVFSAFFVLVSVRTGCARKAFGIQSGDVTLLECLKRLHTRGNGLQEIIATQHTETDSAPTELPTRPTETLPIPDAGNVVSSYKSRRSHWICYPLQWHAVSSLMLNFLLMGFRNHHRIISSAQFMHLEPNAALNSQYPATLNCLATPCQATIFSDPMESQ